MLLPVVVRCVIYALLYSTVLNIRICYSHSDGIFPRSVPVYAVRTFNGQYVRSGLLHTLPISNTLKEFRRHLQCSSIEPNFNHNSGLISIFELAPPTSDHIKQACSYIENPCKSWKECRNNQKRYDEGKVDNSSRFELNQYSFGQLLRVINSSLYYDWPWGIERINTKENENTQVPLIKMTIDRINDLRDSVFFVSGDQPNIKLPSIMPMFSHSSSDRYADLIWPWYEMWQEATQKYKKIRESKLDFVDKSFETLEDGYLPWDKREPKAAYYATLFRNRQFMYDVARLNPDLFEAFFNGEMLPVENLQPWNPNSTEVWWGDQDPMNKGVAAAQSLPAGYVQPLLKLTVLGKNVRYKPGQYKYVIVPVGAGVGLSTSSRIHHILSYSGAVVLLQSSSFKFHFSAQLKPWVHYVPLSFSGADVAEKVRWLREHDDMARQIAENGRNFARSYLRLEDFYCYAAAALDLMAEISSKTDAAKMTFSPRPIQPLNIRFGDSAQYEWPV